MPQVKITRRDGEVQIIEWEGKTTLMRAIRDIGGVDELLALCGGCCSCGTCHVHVAPEYYAILPPAGEDEIDLLDGSEHRNSYSRLSCQINLVDDLDGLSATIAAED